MVAKLTVAAATPDKAIRFNGEMILALFDGRKTRARKLLLPQPGDGPPSAEAAPFAAGDRLWVREAWRLPAQFDRLDWPHVAAAFIAQGAGPAELAQLVPVTYCADGARSAAWSPELVPGVKRDPRFMPRALSRAFLTVSAVRLERLQDITEAEAEAEGVTIGPEVQGVRCGLDGKPLHVWGTGQPGPPALTARQAFARLWDIRHGGPATGWTANPWVAAGAVAITKSNIDA